ncbi:hypothetical protein CR513_28836, partial [Mucuna pruriens]
MEHLPIHLPSETRMGGPVQYHWMYPFERFLNKIKKTVKNKKSVEGSICEAYLLQETSYFSSHYFVSPTGATEEVHQDHIQPTLSIFKPFGQTTGKYNERWLSDKELMAAQLHVLLNCNEVRQNHQLRLQNPNLYDLARGPLRLAKSYPIYFVNGYKFHTIAWGEGKTTYNSGVCVSGIGHDEASNDYYGVLVEILELEWPSQAPKKLVLFYCNWFDPSNRGMRMHKQYKIVELQFKFIIRLILGDKRISNATIEDDPIEHLRDDEIDGEEVDLQVNDGENDFIGEELEKEDDFMNDEDEEEDAFVDEEEDAFLNEKDDAFLDEEEDDDFTSDNEEVDDFISDNEEDDDFISDNKDEED